MNDADRASLFSSPVLRVDDLELRIGGRCLVSGLSFEVKAGECWVILGQNGSGKSTLCRALAGGIAPAGGRIGWFGRAIESIGARELARSRAYMAQDQSDVFGLSVMQTVLLARYPFGRHWESEADIDAARQALRTLDAEHLSGRDIRTLSGGERQRVALASALAQDTPALILDEPTNHLDLPHQMALASILRRTALEDGRAVILVAHDVNWATRFVTHGLLLGPGEHWAAGPVETILNEQRLGECLGYPVTAVEHHHRRLWLPAE